MHSYGTGRLHYTMSAIMVDNLAKEGFSHGDTCMYERVRVRLYFPPIVVPCTLDVCRPQYSRRVDKERVTNQILGYAKYAAQIQMRRVLADSFPEGQISSPPRCRSGRNSSASLPNTARS
jgi:hypothetical protein